MARDSASEEDQTEFNSAVATLRRIDAIKKGLIQATIDEDTDNKWRFLKAYYFELVSVLKDKDDVAQRERFKAVRKSFNVYSQAKRLKKPTIPMQVIDDIDDWEIELKNLEQKYGMNMGMKADPRYAMASR